MKRSELREALREQTAAVRVSPGLRQRAIAAAYEKEKKTVKKKISMALAFALIGVLLCSAALAAAMSRAGIIDFISRYADTYIPEDAADYVQTDGQVLELDEATVTVREIYYDGRTARVTADVAPKDEGTLLMGVDTWLEDPWQDLITLTWSEIDESDTRSVADVFAEKGYDRAYNVNLSCEEETTRSVVTGTQDFVLGEDGVLTVFAQWEFDSDLPEREIALLALLHRYDAGEDGMPVSTNEVDRYPLPVTLRAAKRGEEGQAYINTEPVLYESIGVRVDWLLIEAKPLELYATIDYTVVDEELFAAADDGLWFEFVDETIETDQPYEQRLAEGLTGCGTVDRIGRGRFRQKETLGLSELRDAYTLRAYECWEKQRFDTHDIVMRPAGEEDIARMQAQVLSKEEIDALIDELAREQEDGNG